MQNLELTDNIFKNLNHCIGDLIIETNGKSLINGYSPDLSLKNKAGDLVYILENERKTDRKAFLGDVVKASHYCDITQNTATLIIVMKETTNQTTTIQIYKHLKTYFQWMKSKGILALTDILVISDNEYKKSVECNESIGSKEFIKRCLSSL